MNKKNIIIGIILLILVGLLIFFISLNMQFGKDGNRETLSLEGEEKIEISKGNIIGELKDYPERFKPISGIDVPYPEDGVKGIYMSPTGFSDDEIRNRNINLIEKSNLNSVVLDLKDDNGYIVSNIRSDHPWVNENINAIYDIDFAMDLFEEKQIYPIARIVVFKDSVLSRKHTDYSFKENGELWVRSNGDLFSNPFSKEVWDYNVEIAKAAAEAGFKEVQFDYIRYPEGFGSIHGNMEFDRGVYEGSNEELSILRIKSINDFIAYAKEELKPYGIKVGIDIFGYTTVVGEDRGIGQNFTDIAQRADVISAMIYPSHWGPGNFNLPKPDKDPYNLTDRYMGFEGNILGKLEDPPISRPWLQDFTAAYLGEGNYIEYGEEEVLAQTRALREHGINEFLLWNSANSFTELENY